MTANAPALRIDRNVEGALTQLKQSSPNEANLLFNYISDLKNKEVVALGIDEAFALRNETGEIKAFKQALTLSAQDGTLVQPVFNGPHVVSAQGYEVWAEAAGASCIFPKEVLVNGEYKPNPHAERDPNNRRILAVHARAIAFRFSTKGIPQVSDWSTIFDTPSYRLIDLLGKAKKLPQAFRLYPVELGKPEDDGTWAKYPFDESTNLWVNTAHNEALTWFAQILNREKKSMDFAQTFAKRNALKHLSGIQKAPAAQWTIPVICWRPTNGNIVKWDATQYSQLQDNVNSMIQGDSGAFESGAQTPQLELKTGSGRVSDESDYEAMEANTDPEDQTDVINVQSQAQERASEQPAPQKQVKTQAPDLSPEDEKAIRNAAATMSMFPPEYAQACAELKLPNKIPTTGKHADAIYAIVNRIVEEQA